MKNNWEQDEEEIERARKERQQREREANDARLLQEYEALGIEPIRAGGFLVSPTLARKLGAIPVVSKNSNGTSA